MATLLRPSDLVLSLACVVAAGIGSTGLVQSSQKGDARPVMVATDEGPQQAVPSIPPLEPALPSQS